MVIPRRYRKQPEFIWHDCEHRFRMTPWVKLRLYIRRRRNKNGFCPKCGSCNVGMVMY